MSVFPQNLSNACHTEQKSPPHSKFQDELEKAPVLVRIRWTPASRPHAQALWSAPVLGSCVFGLFFQNCSVAVCKRIQCDLPSFNTQEMFNVTLKGKLSFDWYIKVGCALRLSGYSHNSPEPRPGSHSVLSTDFSQTPPACEHRRDCV